MNCSGCGLYIPDHVRNCVVCDADVGTPNVRAANNDEETEALQDRVRKAEKAARLQGTRAVLKDFQQTVDTKSVAVICRPVGKFKELISSDNELYNTYYKSVFAGIRIPEDNTWDKMRPAVDNLLFPYYADQICFASLSLNGRGIADYGNCCAVLNEKYIANRTSVFEENTCLFVKKNGIVPGNPLPKGYRATWASRGSLAVAKLGHLLTAATTAAEYPDILTNPMTTEPDFIEVNIYGPIHRRAIKHFVGSKFANKVEELMFDTIKEKLRAIGVTVEEK